MNSEDGYKEARKLLAKRFGDPFHVAQAYKTRLKTWPQVSEGDGLGMQEFSDYLIRCRDSMKTMRSLEELNSTETLLHVSSKLPSYSGVRWCRHAFELRRRTDGSVTFSDLVEFIKSEADLAMDPTFSPHTLVKERMKGSGRSTAHKGHPPRGITRANALSTSSSVKTRPSHATQGRRCLSCSGYHTLDDCPEFKKLSLEDRLHFVRTSNLCFGCFSKGHMSKACRNRMTCKKCGKQHPTTLHQDSKTQTESTLESGAEERSSERPHVSNCANVSNALVWGDCVVNSMIIPVWLSHQDNPQEEVMVYALLDDASDTTFVRTSTLQALGVQGVDVKLNLHTMHGNTEIPAQRIKGLTVKRLDKRVEVVLPNAYSRDCIPSRRNQIPKPETANVWPHLKRIADKIPPYKEDMEVALLIGCNCPKAIKPREVILGKGDDPYAVRTLLGWGILGPVSLIQDDVNKDVDVSCNRIVTREVGFTSIRNDRFVVPIKSREVLDPGQVNRMFNLDFSEVNSKEHPLSQEERRFMERAKQGICLCPDGHYEMPLPLKNAEVVLPNNRELALRRLIPLKKRFSSCKSYQDQYTAFMDSMFKNGYAEKVSMPDPADGSKINSRVWYIPHHGVFHPKKPSKIRVVFDCSAVFKEESLNKHLLQGPDLTNNLCGVLCRFRLESVAFMCDIEAMFYQVRVTEDCRDMLRFLWWENGDTSRQPQEYRMAVHLFGAASSPACSNYALKTTADDNENELGPAPAEFLRKDFYVDDGLKSVPSVGEAIDLIKGVKEMCKRGGFNLHKFTSNKKEVIAGVPVEDRAEEIKLLDLNHDKLPMERALGVQWCVESDCFRFRITLSDRPCTRRGILSTVSSIYDPLGFLAPFLVEGKKIIQELCQEKADWDDPVPDHMRHRWDNWKAELAHLEEFSIARCYKPEGFGNVVSVQLHHFSDASVKGYGQCSYLRFQNDMGKVHCAFVFGKARVTPLKPITLIFF